MPSVFMSVRKPSLTIDKKAFYRYNHKRVNDRGVRAMHKDTSKIVEELMLCPDFKTFYDENRSHIIETTLAEHLAGLIQKYDLKKAQVVHDAEISEVYAYQILSGQRVPERKKLLCLAVAMKLSLDEVQTLLRHAGYPMLYVKLPLDSVIMYGICKRLSVSEINELLYEYQLETLS